MKQRCRSRKPGRRWRKRSLGARHIAVNMTLPAASRFCAGFASEDRTDSEGRQHAEQREIRVDRRIFAEPFWTKRASPHHAARACHDETDSTVTGKRPRCSALHERRGRRLFRCARLAAGWFPDSVWLCFCPRLSWMIDRVWIPQFVVVLLFDLMKKALAME